MFVFFATLFIKTCVENNMIHPTYEIGRGENDVMRDRFWQKCQSQTFPQREMRIIRILFLFYVSKAAISKTRFRITKAIEERTKRDFPSHSLPIFDILPNARVE